MVAPKPKLTFADLQKKYDHLEWDKCIETDHWIVQAINPYGKPAYIKFPTYLSSIDIESIESGLMTIDDYRQNKKYNGIVTLGRYITPAPSSDRGKK